MSSNFKLYISPYKLKFKNQLSLDSQINKADFIEGALLAFEFDSHLTGYSDFLPWPDFGEETLEQQLHKIKQGIFSKRFLIARQNAFLDAKARLQKQNLFFGLKIPESHFLIAELLSFNQEKLIIEKGFKTVKVKLKPSQIPKQTAKLKCLYADLKHIKWRFDLNGQSWGLWKSRLNFLKENIDFIEDPLNDKYIKEKEKKLFAQDWIPNPFHKIKIVKPSRDSLKELAKELAFFHWKRLIFTHSFDHPLGQAITAFWAGHFYKTYPPFFETGGLSFSPLLETASYPLNQKQEPVFTPPSGYGFGFAESLKKEKWKRWL